MSRVKSVPHRLRVVSATACVAACWACATIPNKPRRVPLEPPVSAAAPVSSSAAPRWVDSAKAKELDGFINHAQQQLEVPGGAVAILRDDRVIYQRVFGVRELGSPELVSPSTLFMIGSTTKSMTTMMEASLVDSGRLSWDTRLTTLWPSFAVGDAELTQQLEVWHSSCMCTGIRSPDLEYLFEYENVTPEVRVASLSEVSPTAALQERSMYSNLMAAAGGYVAAQAFAPGQSLGEAYTAAMQTTVFTPIGMSSTTLDFAVVARREHASPHALAFDGTTHALPVSAERNVIAIAPAGAVWSNLDDMVRFVHTELNGGVAPSGRQVVSRKNLLRRRKASVRFGKSGHYGLGVILSTVGDFPSVGHDGGSLGFGTTMRMLPKHRLGIIILTNIRNGGPSQQLPFNKVVSTRIVELLVGPSRQSADAQLTGYVKARRERIASWEQGLDHHPEAGWLAGTYSNEKLGTVVISGRNFDAGEWQTKFALRNQVDGPTKLVFLDPPFAGTEVAIGGGPSTPQLIVEVGTPRYVFEKSTH